MIMFHWINKYLTTSVKWLINNKWMSELSPRPREFPVHGKGPFVIAFFDDGSYFITNVSKGSIPSDLNFEPVVLYNTKTLVNWWGFFDKDTFQTKTEKSV